jgi:hypothetical protein
MGVDPDAATLSNPWNFLPDRGNIRENSNFAKISE